MFSVLHGWDTGNPHPIPLSTTVPALLTTRGCVPLPGSCLVPTVFVSSHTDAQTCNHAQPTMPADGQQTQGQLMIQKE